MPVFINAKGTSVNQFQFGKKGVKLYGGDARPVKNVQTGEILLDKSNSAIAIAKEGAQTPVFKILITEDDITKSTIDALGVDAASLGSVAASNYARTDQDETFTGNVTVQGTLFFDSSISFNSRTFTSDGVTTEYTVSAGVTADSVLVFDNGELLLPGTDYTVSGTTLTLTTTASNTRVLHIREILV